MLSPGDPVEKLTCERWQSRDIKGKIHLNKEQKHFLTKLGVLRKLPRIQRRHSSYRNLIPLEIYTFAGSHSGLNLVWKKHFVTVVDQKG